MRRLIVLLSGCVALMCLTARVQASDWQLRSGSLSFSGTQQGEPFTGAFSQFDGHLQFDPEHPEATVLSVNIDLRSANSNSEERDSTLQSAEWFNTEQQPMARFVAKGGRRLPDGRFELPATLHIHAKQKDLAFPFTWTATPDGGKLDSTVALNRLDFDLGTGDWADPEWVGHEVTVTVSVIWQAAPPEQGPDSLNSI